MTRFVGRFVTLMTEGFDLEEATRLTTIHRGSESCWTTKRCGGAPAVRGRAVAAEAELAVPTKYVLPVVVDAQVFRDNARVPLRGSGRNLKAASDDGAVLAIAEVDSRFAVRGLGCSYSDIPE